MIADRSLLSQRWVLTLSLIRGCKRPGADWPASLSLYTPYNSGRYRNQCEVWDTAGTGNRQWDRLEIAEKHYNEWIGFNGEFKELSSTPCSRQRIPRLLHPILAPLRFRIHSPARRLSPPPPPLHPFFFLHLPLFISSPFLSSPPRQSFHAKLLLGYSYPSSSYLLARVIYLRSCRISAPINATAIPLP